MKNKYLFLNTRIILKYSNRQLLPVNSFCVLIFTLITNAIICILCKNTKIWTLWWWNYDHVCRLFGNIVSIRFCKYLKCFPHFETCKSFATHGKYTKWKIPTRKTSLQHLFRIPLCFICRVHFVRVSFWIRIKQFVYVYKYAIKKGDIILRTCGVVAL